MGGDGFVVDGADPRVGLPDAAPQARGGQRQQCQAEDRQEHQPRLHARRDGAGPLAVGDQAGEHLQPLRWQMAQYPLAQLAALVDDLVHPQRRQPGPVGGATHQSRHDLANDRARMVDRSVEPPGCLRHRAPDEGNDRHHALVHDGIKQLVAAFEVVVQHRRRHPGARGDMGDAGSGHPLGGEQVSGDVQQLVADGGAVGPRRAARAACGGSLGRHGADSN